MRVAPIDVDSKIPSLSVMPYDKSGPYQRALARRCDDKFIFKACPGLEGHEGARRPRKVEE